jgi:uncharacterized repeat protein (TIGR04076 family)
MDRRRFCKIATLAVGALGLSAVDAQASRLSGHAMPSLKMPCACRVTVIRKECYMDIQSLYLDDPDEGACPACECGDAWTFSHGSICPEGFCRQAWGAIVSIMNLECSKGNDGVRVVACPDGARPVVFKVVRL